MRFEWQPGRMSLGALSHRNFRLYYAGHIVSLLGWWMHQVAQPWLVLTLTDSAFAVGLVAALGSFPVTLFSLLGGAAADRFPKRPLILVTHVISMVVVLLLAAVVLLDVVRLWHVVVAAALIGTVAAFDMPGRQSFLFELVGKRDLMNAIALNSSAFSASRVVGPSLGGIIIALVGVAYCFVINGLSYLAVVVALLFMRVPHEVAESGDRQRPRIRDGIRFVMEDDRLRGLVIVLATSSLFGFSFQVLVPVLARQVLNQGAEGFGLMLSATGVGALSGALGLALFGKRAAKGKIVSIASVTFGLCLASLGMVRVFPVALGILCLVGFTMINQTATTNTLLQTLAPDDLRGRIVSIYTLAFIGLMPFGSLLAGSLSDRWGPGPVLVGGGLVTATVALSALRRTPELWSVP